MLTIDINCDLGEGFPNDDQLMPFISSANIACGFHAGDMETMQRMVDCCLIEEVAIGAHPGFNDKAGFGRIPMQLSDNELFDLIAVQVEAMQKICRKEGTLLHHVKPHGALYNMAAADQHISHIIASAIQALDPTLILYGLSNSQLISEAKKIKLPVASEVFIDRTYQADGSLTPRSTSNALINTEEALNQCLQMILSKTITAVDGTIIPIEADTICIHGDGEHALEFAKALHHSFVINQIHLKTFGT